MHFTHSTRLFCHIHLVFFLTAMILTTQFLLQTTHYRLITINYLIRHLFALPRGLPGGFLGVGWGLAGGSEGSIPRNPQPTPRKGLPKSLYREFGWIPGTGFPEIEKEGGRAKPV